MTLNNKILFGLSTAVLLTISVVSLAYTNTVFAEDKQLEFPDEPHFVSKACIMTSFATDNLPQESLDNLDCKFEAWLDYQSVAMQYRITITGMQLIDSNGTTEDDVNQLHIHKNTLGTAEDPRGPHQLNVFREPNFDDSDVVIKPVQGVIEGIWDDGDENLSFGEPDNSHTLTENIELLCNNNIFAAAHGDVEDRADHKAPYIKMLLEAGAKLSLKWYKSLNTVPNIKKLLDKEVSKRMMKKGIKIH